jgi:peptidyl-dipeptidase A
VGERDLHHRDTNELAAYFGTIDTQMRVRLANESARYADVPGLSYDTKRKIDVLRSSLTLPGADPRRRRGRAQPPLHRPAGPIWPRPRHDGRPAAGRQRDRGADGHRPQSRPAPGDVDQLERQCRRADARRISAARRIANEGAKELGYDDTGAMWRSKYDMTPGRVRGDHRAAVERGEAALRGAALLHRGRPQQEIWRPGAAGAGPIRADLLGNLWAQEWGNIYDVVAPRSAGGEAYDLTQLLTRAKYTPEKIVRTGEQFFSSLGFAPLPRASGSAR